VIPRTHHAHIPPVVLLGNVEHIYFVESILVTRIPSRVTTESCLHHFQTVFARVPERSDSSKFALFVGERPGKTSSVVAFGVTMMSTEWGINLERNLPAEVEGGETLALTSPAWQKCRRLDFRGPVSSSMPTVPSSGLGVTLWICGP